MSLLFLSLHASFAILAIYKRSDEKYAEAAYNMCWAIVMILYYFNYTS